MNRDDFYLLNDMEKYNPHFDRKSYESRPTEEVIAEFRKFYENFAAVDLLTWCRVNEPGDTMIYKSGYWDQICFVKDVLLNVCWKTYDDYKKNPPLVVGTHTSKSIDLPIYKIKLSPDVTIYMRYNFHDWKITVDSTKPIDIYVYSRDGLFNPGETISSCYCEGFDRAGVPVYGSYHDSRNQFTIEIGNNYKLYTFLHLVMNCIYRPTSEPCDHSYQDMPVCVHCGEML